MHTSATAHEIGPVSVHCPFGSPAFFFLLIIQKFYSRMYEVGLQLAVDVHAPFTLVNLDSRILSKKDSQK